MPDWKQTKVRASYEKRKQSSNISTKFLSVERDINALIISAIQNSNGDIDQFLNYFKDLKELKELSRTLAKNRDELEVLFNEMKEAFNKAHFTGGEENQETTALLSLMKDVANQTADRNDIEKNLAIGLFENDQYNPLIGMEQYKSMINFMERYWDLKQSFFSASSKFNERTEQIRGDKQYYGIFLEAAKNSQGELLNKNQTDRFMILSRQQFEQFEKENPDLFDIQISERFMKRSGGMSRSEGTVRSFGLKSGISSQEIYQKMIATFGENGVSDILDQVYATTNNGDKLKYRNIFEQLRGSTDESLQKFNASRRLEMLFDSDFRNQIIAGSSVKDAISFINTSKYGENIFGAATGDVNLQTQNGVIALQLKYKNDQFLPWNNQGFQGMIDGINTFVNIGEKFLNGNEGRQLAQDLLFSNSDEEYLIQKIASNQRLLGDIQDAMGDFTIQQFAGDNFFSSDYVIPVGM